MTEPLLRLPSPGDRPQPGLRSRSALLLLALALVCLPAACGGEALPGTPSGDPDATAPAAAASESTVAPATGGMPLSGTAPGEGGPLRSMADRFEVRYAADSDPILVNTMHGWVVNLRRVDGTAVEGARITVSGDMPAHGHGMPTQPEMTEELGGGDYRIEGMKFQMGGAWEVYLDIVDATGQADRVVLPLEFN